MDRKHTHIDTDTHIDTHTMTGITPPHTQSKTEKATTRNYNVQAKKHRNVKIC